MNPFDFNKEEEEKKQKPKGMKMAEDMATKIILEKTPLNEVDAKELAKAVIGAAMVGMLMDVALGKNKG